MRHLRPAFYVAPQMGAELGGRDLLLPPVQRQPAQDQPPHRYHNWLDGMTTLAILASALVSGGMLFFAVIIAPFVFTHLPEADAARFIRALFPRYYLFMAIAAAAAAVLAATAHFLAASIMVAVAIGFVVARQFLMPAINRARDAELAGNEVAAGRFARLHRLSVGINSLQLVASVGVLIGLTI